MLHWLTVWEFKTANYTVALEITGEHEDPKALGYSKEEAQEIYASRVNWFVAAVRVYKHGRYYQGVEIGSDFLGGCAYNSIKEFYTSHRDPNPMNRNCTPMRNICGPVTISHYFPSMVRAAIREARAHERNRDAYTHKPTTSALQRHLRHMRKTGG